MLNWIGDFVGRWSGVVTAPIRDLVHWAVHALASVVYTVFGNVGGIWRDLANAWGLVNRMLDKYIPAVWDAFRRVFLVDLPALWRWITSHVAAAFKLMGQLYDKALAYALGLYHTLVHLLDQLAAWVNTHVLQPLLDITRQLRSDLLKWGYTAWWYLTHPDKLAPLILSALIQAAEDAFWTISGPVLKFILRLVLSNAHRLAQLAETVIAAVL